MYIYMYVHDIVCMLISVGHIMFEGFVAPKLSVGRNGPVILQLVNACTQLVSTSQQVYTFGENTWTEKLA